VSTPGFWEIVFLAMLALLIFGPKRLPEVARGVGKAISSFRREASSTLDELKRSADFAEIKGLTDEVRSTTNDLKRSVALSGPVASSARPSATGKPTVRAEGPPPFDPDAT
jgi:sec-independent protein translocase protein TatB